MNECIALNFGFDRNRVLYRHAFPIDDIIYRYSFVGFLWGIGFILVRLRGTRSSTRDSAVTSQSQLCYSVTSQNSTLEFLRKTSGHHILSQVIKENKK